MPQTPFPFIDEEIAAKYQSHAVKTPEPTPTAASMSVRDIDFIKQEERLKLIGYQNEYRDTDTGVVYKDKPTIGWGSTMKPDGNPVKKGERITQEQAEEYLQAHLKKQVIPYIERNVKVPLNQNQIDSLASLIYNIGGARFNKSNLLKRLNKGDYQGAAEAFTQFHKGAGVNKLLLERRQREQKLFLKPEISDVLNELRARYRRP